MLLAMAAVTVLEPSAVRSEPDFGAPLVRPPRRGDDPMMKLITAAAGSIISLIGVAATSDAEGAQARCGMTIRGEVKLMQDLTCRETRPIRLIGPKAHLDLNGFYLSCGYGTTENPILMLEQGALLRNGNLSECTVKLLDRGGHKVRNVGVFTFDHRALIIASDSNEWSTQVSARTIMRCISRAETTTSYPTTA